MMVFEIRDAGYNLLGWSRICELADTTADQIERTSTRETVVYPVEQAAEHTDDLEIVPTETAFPMTIRAFSVDEESTPHVVRVDASGDVRVYDDVAGFFTRCHSMKPWQEKLARKMAATLAPALPNSD